MKTKLDIDFASLRRMSSTARTRYLDLMNAQEYEIRKEERLEYPQPRSIHKRVRNALLTIVGGVDLWHQIEGCHFNPIQENKSNRAKFGICGSFWCAGCRNNMAKRHYQKVIDRINSGRYLKRNHLNPDAITTVKDGKFVFPSDHTIEEFEYQNKDFQHITGVLGLCRLRTDDLQELLRQDRNRWKRISRRINKQTREIYWIEIAYEIELVNWNYLKDAPASDMKKEQMKMLLQHYDRSKTGEHNRELFLFVHFHGITNLTKKKINTVFQQEYFINENIRLPKTYKETGLYIQNLHSNKTLEENIKRITSYPFKNPIRYKHSFRGNDYTSGEDFTMEELGLLVKISKDFYGRNGRSMFRSICNDLRLWDQISVNLKSVLRDLDDQYSNGRRRMGRSKNEIYGNIKSVGKLLSKIRRLHGNSPKTPISKLLTDELLQQKLGDQNTINWKLDPPYGKKQSKAFYTNWYK